MHNRISVYQTKIRIGDQLVKKKNKSINHKGLQSSFYEKLIYIQRYFKLFIDKKIVQFLH